MRTLLVTGFGPFPGWDRNPSPAMVLAVSRLHMPGWRIVPHVFDTVYAGVARDLPALIARHRPEAVLLFGLAGRTGHVRIERFAHNVTTRRTRDASGAFHVASDIAADGPWRMATDVRTGPLVAALRRAAINARPSASSGQYVCNFSYWLALEAAKRGAVKRVLFVHVPLPPRGRRAAGRAGKPLPLARRLDAADLERVAVMAARALAGR